MWKGRKSELLFLGAATALAFVARQFFGCSVVGCEWRRDWWSQLASADAPAAYYIGTGRLDGALCLWAVNWIFAGNQIHFVQLRIRAARAITSPKV